MLIWILYQHDQRLLFHSHGYFYHLLVLPAVPDSFYCIIQCISQCYAVEGCYPPSLEYLEQHYGLLYDEDSFFIDYEYYGSNLLPEVTVLRRTGAH